MIGVSGLAPRYDVAVIGGGPAGSTVASLLASREGLKVALIDPKLEAEWPNNYGSWAEEWSALAERLPEFDLESCAAGRWETTDCFFGGSWGIDTNHKTKLDRAYIRVDRQRLREAIRSHGKFDCFAASVPCTRSDWALNVYNEENIIEHDGSGTQLQLSSGEILRATIVVDATGFSSKLTLRADSPAPGYQIAYGFEADVSSYGDYDPEAMLLFDYRDNYLQNVLEKKTNWPTFMYAMPMGPGKSPGTTRVFFEETVLVSRPAMTLEECEQRAMARLDYMGIKLASERTDIELCFIPMGGPIPDPNQRIIAFGAAAAVVHPATGYQLCRCLTAASDLTSTIGKALKNTQNNPDLTARAAYGAIWPKSIVHQRDFALFGAEFLLSCNTQDLRGWFTAFFLLPTSVWAGFLAGWPGLPGNQHHETRLNRLLFGLDMFRRLPPQVALKLISFMLLFSFQEGPALLRSVTPFFGDNPAAFEDSSDVLASLPPFKQQQQSKDDQQQHHDPDAVLVVENDSSSSSAAAAVEKKATVAR